MGNKKRGYILLHRKIWDNEIWDTDEPFDMRSAWVDLLLMVNHEERTIVVNCTPVVVGRGQKWTSVRVLADRWHWSTKRTLNYLKLLEKLRMITRKTTKRGTLLTVINYSKMQISRNTNDYTTDYTADNTTDYTADNETIHYRNNYRNNVKNKEAPPRDSWGEVVE